MCSEALLSEMRTKNSNLCIGLDIDSSKIPRNYQNNIEKLLAYNCKIIDVTHPFTIAYKLNFAFYLALGNEGLYLLQKTLEHIPINILKIIDAKVGDIPNTAEMYAKTFFEVFNADALTVHPYMGFDSFDPYLNYPDKWIFIVCLTSNDGGIAFQTQGNLYQNIIDNFTVNHNNQNIGFVIGAKNKDLVQTAFSKMKGNWVLAPGFGAQGGDLDFYLQCSLKYDVPFLVNVGRSIIFAENNNDFPQNVEKAAKEYQQLLKNYCIDFIKNHKFAL